MLFKVTKVTHRPYMSEMHISTAPPLLLGHIDKLLNKLGDTHRQARQTDETRISTCHNTATQLHLAWQAGIQIN